MHFQQELMPITDSTAFKLLLTGACLNRADTVLWLKLMKLMCSHQGGSSETPAAHAVPHLQAPVRSSESWGTFCMESAI